MTDNLRLDSKMARMKSDTVDERETVILFDAWFEVQHPYIQHVVNEHIDSLKKAIPNFGDVSAKVLLTQVYLFVGK